MPVFKLSLLTQSNTQTFFLNILRGDMLTSGLQYILVCTHYIQNLYLC